jgi:hypothetical protein
MNSRRQSENYCEITHTHTLWTFSFCLCSILKVNLTNIRFNISIAYPCA